MSRQVSYPAILDDAENDPGVYSVEFPDVPSALTYGTGTAQALLRASEALGLSLYDASKLPEPTSLSDVQRSNPDKIVSLVAVDLDEIMKRVKIV
ncbi:type II toxin-antitoxin system HicB family antitoxin [Companilactobacillus ginsenosidimutans]|uniref:type II toxin-antitoxin system HicB family antitoxin n=1 Tax=Companilactobacillus ginsenosidimutans TaxID=1007676 RepID=UPI00069EBA37|nr:type II toxin-antitoxin system HicB family antitoxin [Companilactobacillus ginsenosidimutans]